MTHITRAREVPTQKLPTRQLPSAPRRRGRLEGGGGRANPVSARRKPPSPKRGNLAAGPPSEEAVEVAGRAPRGPAGFLSLQTPCCSNEPPTAVSPGRGSRSTRTTKSTLIEPTTMTLGRIGRIGRGGRAIGPSLAGRTPVTFQDGEHLRSGSARRILRPCTSCRPSPPCATPAGAVSPANRPSAPDRPTGRW